MTPRYFTFNREAQSRPCMIACVFLLLPSRSLLSTNRFVWTVCSNIGKTSLSKVTVASMASVQNGGSPPAAPKTKKANVEEIYQKKSQLEHILLRPDTYIGKPIVTQKFYIHLIIILINLLLALLLLCRLCWTSDRKYVGLWQWQ